MINCGCKTVFALILWFGWTSAAFSQTEAPRVRPNDRVPEEKIAATVALRGNVHPMARPEDDLGPVPGDQVMNRMTLVLRRSAEQQTALDQLIEEQQDPGSPKYHQWLTPETYREHFGLSDHDTSSLKNWLRGQGFTVDESDAGGGTISFSGTVAVAETAFQTKIRHYRIANALHYANATDPQIPAAFADVVAGVIGLHDFEPSDRESSAEPKGVDGNGNHYLDPSDFATIYNLTPLYQSGITGDGQTIAIIQRCSVSNSLIQVFRKLENLPASTVVINQISAPDINCFNDNEASLDAEWAGAVAKGATIEVVVAGTVEASAQYIVNNRLAPVVSGSFSQCEDILGASGRAFWSGLWQQAASFGMTVVISSGDSGAANCDDISRQTPPATHGLSVSGICATPYNVCVGGSRFNDATNQQLYWATKGAALGYIPETAWNESATTGPVIGLWASGGGYSKYVPRPSWQTGNPNAQRGVPDVALSAAGHDPYRYCSPFQNCDAFSISEAGGTSVAAPAFAGIMALIVQKTGQWQGNANQAALYSLAARTDLGVVFHDITTGNNTVPGQTGYAAAPGWDPVTGLGSVDATALATYWAGGTIPGPTVTLSSSQLSFGNQVVGGNSSAQVVTLTNKGPGVVNIGNVTGAGADPNDFPIDSSCANTVLAATKTCNIAVAFQPNSVGARSAVISISTTPTTSPLTILAAGTGLSPVAFTNLEVTKSAPGSGCAPPPAATSFATGDGTVYLFFSATLTARDALTSDWLAPNGDDVPGNSWAPAAGTFCFGNASLDVRNASGTRLGTWQARIFDNGKLIASVSFNVVSPLQLVTTPPCRVLDTRNANGPFGGPFVAGGTIRAIPIPSSGCRIPANAAAYSLNFTVVPRAGTLGYLSVWPDGQPQPLVSTLNSPDGAVLANAAIVPAGSAGAIDAFATNDTDLIVDINGYFVPPAANTLQFYPLPPCRVLDTRNANSAFGGPSIGGGTSRSFPVPSGSCGAPAKASAYSFNVTVAPHGALGYLTAWPAGQAQPLVSTLNSFDGTILANAAIVPAGADGGASFFASDTTDLVVDINGYFAPPGTGGLNFYPLTPCRLVDTRNPNGTLAGPTFGSNTTRAFPLSQGSCGLPGVPAAQAYSVNLTVVPQGPLGYLATWPTGVTQPVVSTLNAFKGSVVANAAIVPAGGAGSINVYVTNATDVVIDTNGYFGP